MSYFYGTQKAEAEGTCSLFCHTDAVTTANQKIQRKEFEVKETYDKIKNSLVRFGKQKEPLIRERHKGKGVSHPTCYTNMKYCEPHPHWQPAHLWQYTHLLRLAPNPNCSLEWGGKTQTPFWMHFTVTYLNQNGFLRSPGLLHLSEPKVSNLERRAHMLHSNQCK